MSTEIEEGTAQVFSVGEHPRLSVDIGSSDIVVTAGDQGSIRVHVLHEEHHFSEPECFADGDHVHVRARGKERHASFAIEVPPACAVYLHTAKGDMEVQGIRGGLEIGTVGGDVRMEDVSGGCRLHTVTGDIEARRLSGALSVQTTNGDTTVKASRLDDFNLHSVNGDFSIETSLEPGTHYFAKTTNGDVHLIVPADAGLTVQLQTTNGEVKTDLPLETLNRSRRTWQARVNGGGANLEMHSVKGDLRISASGQYASWGQAGSPPSSYSTFVMDALDGGESDERGSGTDGDHRATPPGTANGGESAHAATVVILAQLESGDLTVEEAMAQLDQMQTH